MSWDIEMIVLIRNYIGDTAVSPKYSDTNIKSLILSSTQFVVYDLGAFVLQQNYISDVVGVTLTPDPTIRDANGNRDDGFINLIVLRVAWVVGLSELRTYGSQAIGIRDGTSSVDLKRDLKSLHTITKSLEENYTEYKNRYIRNSTSTGEIITSPFKFLRGSTFCGQFYRSNRW